MVFMALKKCSSISLSINCSPNLFYHSIRFRNHQKFAGNDKLHKTLLVRSRRHNLKGRMRKFNQYAWHMKGMPVDEALIQMRFARSSRGYEFFSLIRNAQSNAVNNFGMNPNHLIIESVEVSRAKQPKVLQIRGKGQARIIKLKHSHLRCTVSENQFKTNIARRGSKDPKYKLVATDAPKPSIVIN